MNFSDYIEKLRRKPARERERIAVFATALAFLVILGIWLVSFSESNKQSTAAQNSPDISNQLDSLKNNFGQSKQSIQDMMQNLPQDTATMDNSDNSGQNTPASSEQSPGTGSAGDMQNQDTADQSKDNSQQSPNNNPQNAKQEIPQLP
jgi:predicted PurR-regulated permease PerM